MREVTKIIGVRLYAWDEAPYQYRQLLEDAIRARNGAQPSYSKYRVGCAMRSAQGKIYTGANVENVAYTPTMHAEWLAASSLAMQEGIAQAEGYLVRDRFVRKIAAVAVVGAPGDVTIALPPKPWPPGSFPDDPFQWSIAPCGLCRQVIWENCMGDPSVPLIELTPTGEVSVTTMGEAYPFPFGPDALGIDVWRA
ncbi:MAG TPA: hypothetical protein VJ553_01165 [Candidatus Paceibacterota bacterium]|nr:hypothetical protein [Candidatus Paceibacterota bacterium]